MISSYVKKGYGSNILLVLWVANCFFYVQLFMSEILSNLANSPLLTIDSMEQIIDEDRDVVIILEKTSFAYNNYLQVILIICYFGLNLIIVCNQMQIKYPQLRYENYISYDLQSNKLINRILSGSSVLIADETLVDEIIFMNPGLPIHKSETTLMLGIGGLFVRKALDSEIKETFKRK